MKMESKTTLNNRVRRTLLLLPVLMMLTLTHPLHSVQAACIDGLDPVGYWRLDEDVPGTDVNFDDSFGDDNATCGGGGGAPDCPVQETVDTLVLNSQDFSGSGTGLVVTDSANDFDWTFNESFSIAAWIKPDTNVGTDVIVGRNDGDMRWFLAISGGRAQGYLENHNNEGEFTLDGITDLMTDNQWHYLVLVRDNASGKTMLYVDGVLEASASVTYSDPTLGSFVSSADINIGHLDTGSGFFRFDGLIDEVAIYNQALSANIINQHAINGQAAMGLCDDAAPVVLTQSSNAAYGIQALEYQVQVAGNPLPTTYSLGAGSPEGLTIDSTGMITWQPLVGQISDTAYSVAVTADNSVGTPGSGMVDITVESFCDADLAGYWKLEEADSDSAIVDASGIGNNGARVGTIPPAQTTSGQVGNAQDFNPSGIDAAIEIPDNDIYDWATGSFSISAWVNTSGSSTLQTVVGRRVSSGAAWRLALASGVAQFFLDDGSTDATLSDLETINDGQWHHLMAVRDDVAGNNLLYVDGVLVAQQAVTYSGDFDITAGVTIGSYDQTGDFDFEGIIDEVALFNKALSGAVADQLVRTTDRGLCNAAPSITSTAPTTGSEDVLYSYTPTVENSDGDTLVWSIADNPTGMTIDSATGQVDWTPSEGTTTSGAVTITVDDQFGGQATEVFTISVDGVNDAPVITSTGFLSAVRGDQYTYDANADDAENDTLTWTLTQGPSGMAMDAGTGVVSWSVPADAPATVDVAIEVSDGNGGTDTESYTITVLDTPNQAPSITSTAPDTATEGQEYTYTPTAEDPESNALTFSISGEPDGMVITNGVITWTPAAGSAGEVTYTVTVQDGLSGEDTQLVTVTVSAADTKSGGGGGGGGGCFIGAATADEHGATTFPLWILSFVGLALVPVVKP